MISSLYGMNVALPFSTNPFAFFFIMMFIFVVSFTAFFYFQKRRWL
jgi:Mg2+ and Co2+ transporter CorA